METTLIVFGAVWFFACFRWIFALARAASRECPQQNADKRVAVGRIGQEAATTSSRGKTQVWNFLFGESAFFAI